MKKKTIKSFKNRNILIAVFNLTKYKNKNELNDFICPSCKNLSILNADNENNDILILNNCIYNHKNTYLSIKNLLESQNIDEKNIKCDICYNSKYLYNDNFYICQCKKYVCQLCIKKHNKNQGHNLLYFNKRYSTCNKHLLKFLSYCSFCKYNLCEKCEEEHISHKNKIVLYKKETQDITKIDTRKNEIKEYILKIDKYKFQIKKINNLINNYINNLNKDLNNHIKLCNKMLILLDNLNNYENIRTVFNFQIEKLNKEINNFLKEELRNKMIYLIRKVNDNINEMSLVYNINNEDTEIKLFDKKFVKNNKDNCFLLPLVNLI